MKRIMILIMVGLTGCSTLGPNTITFKEYATYIRAGKITESNLHKYKVNGINDERMLFWYSKLKNKKH